MIALHAAPTDALSRPLLADLRNLLDAAFDGDFTDEDWEHSIGGYHVWVGSSQRAVSHGSLVERTVVCSGQSLRVGFVEAVATRASHRRRGHGARVMRHIGARIHAQYPVGVLSTGTHGFYGMLGWERWRGPTFVDGLAGIERTPDDDGDVMILRTPQSPSLNLDGDITCDWRRGDVW